MCRIVKKNGHHVTLKILIVRFSRNFFSRTADGIELKSGIYVPMNVFNMFCYCLCHLKIQNGHQLSLLCIGQFVMAIILTWVLFRSKCAELLLDSKNKEWQSTFILCNNKVNCFGLVFKSGFLRCYNIIPSWRLWNWCTMDLDSSGSIYFQLHMLIHSFIILQCHTNDDP